MLDSELQKQYAKAMRAVDSYERWRAFRAIFEKGVFGCDDYGWFINSWLWFKVFICILLNRRRGNYVQDAYLDECACYDMEQCWEYQSMMKIAADKRFFKGWQIEIYRD